jgi:hypothetical protein
MSGVPGRRKDEAASAQAGHQDVSLCFRRSLSGFGKNDFLDLALGQYGDDEHLPEAGGRGFFGLFYPQVGGSGRLAYSRKIGTT